MCCLVPQPILGRSCTSTILTKEEGNVFYLFRCEFLYDNILVLPIIFTPQLCKWCINERQQVWPSIEVTHVIECQQMRTLRRRLSLMHGIWNGIYICKIDTCESYICIIYTCEIHCNFCFGSIIFTWVKPEWFRFHYVKFSYISKSMKM